MSAPTNPGAAHLAPWNLASLVDALRDARAQHVDAEPAAEAAVPVRPSRAAVEGIVRRLRAALFPEHYAESDLSPQGVDFFVGTTLDTTLRDLAEQVRRGLRYEPGGAALSDAEVFRRAVTITRAFADELPRIRALLGHDLRAAHAGDPAARGLDEVLLCYPGFTAITHHRFAHALYTLGATLLARSISEIAHAETGIDIHPGARIGASFFIDHGTGVVIGETAVIGEHVRIYQGVTLGAKRFAVDASGALVKGVARHPVLEDDVVVYAGATILGRVTIGRGSSIGGNVWLTRSVPPNSRITQAQVRSDDFGEGGGI